MLLAMAQKRPKTRQIYKPLPQPPDPITRESAPEVMRLFEVASLLRLKSRRGLEYLRRDPTFPAGFRYRELEPGQERTTSPIYWTRESIFAWLDARAKAAQKR
jgi:hypothetical protein